MNKNKNIGCGVPFKIINGNERETSRKKCEFICGVPNAWDEEKFCRGCKMNMKMKWDEEDRTSKDPRIREIYKLRKEGRLNY